MTSHRLQENSWENVEDYLKTDDRIIIPVGSTEQHGSFAPLGTDTYVALNLAEDATLIARQRGHGVELWEEDQLGGQARLSSLAPCKGETSEVVRYLKHCLDKSDVRVRCGRPTDISEAINMAPDVIVVATGSRPSLLSIPGIDSDFVTDVRKVNQNRSAIGQRIVIIGVGDIGCETADWLADPETQITVVEILPEILHRMKRIPREQLLARLSEKGVTIFTETQITSIKENSVQLRKKDGEIFTIRVDNVFFSINAEPENSLVTALKSNIKEVIAVGDAASPGNIGTALRSATEAALNI
jgi:2-enoate reductase